MNLQTSEFENSPCLSKSYITKAWQYSRENRLQSKHNSFNQRDHAMPCHLCVFHFNWSWKCDNFICQISPQPRNKCSFHHDDDNKFPFNILKPKFSLDPLNRRLHSFTVVILSFLFYFFLLSTMQCKLLQLEIASYFRLILWTWKLNNNILCTAFTYTELKFTVFPSCKINCLYVRPWTSWECLRRK